MELKVDAQTAHALALPSPDTSVGVRSGEPAQQREQPTHHHM